jgi:hypothetical protein
MYIHVCNVTVRCHCVFNFVCYLTGTIVSLSLSLSVLSLSLSLVFIYAQHVRNARVRHTYSIFPPQLPHPLLVIQGHITALNILPHSGRQQM